MPSPNIVEPPQRITSGIPGLDTVLSGGLFAGGIYVVVGPPGAGKTISANQIAFHRARAGQRVAYVTLLTETHGHMLSHLQSLDFFDAARVGDSVLYVDGFTAMRDDGLLGLLGLVRRVVREQRADLLVLDGMRTVSTLAESNVDLKQFINELQTWAGVVGCTTLFLTSADRDAVPRPEHTMVDGVFELSTRRAGVRAERQLFVAKFRGSGFLEGFHEYVIGRGGLDIYPRLESLPRSQTRRDVGRPVGTGIADIDQILQGGLLGGSSTLIVGAPGTGKTVFGLHFLRAGAERGEHSIYYGFFEQPGPLLAKADRFGFSLSRLEAEGRISMYWHPATELSLDAFGRNVLTLVRERGARRLFIDGMTVLDTSIHPERVPAFFAALITDLAGDGVTTFVSHDLPALFGRDLDEPLSGVTAAADNIILLRRVETTPKLTRLMCVIKTRCSTHDRDLHEFEIGDEGVRLLGRFGGDRPSGEPPSHRQCPTGASSPKAPRP